MEIWVTLKSPALRHPGDEFTVKKGAFLTVFGFRQSFEIGKDEKERSWLKLL
jgi:hypothetical protein